MVVSWSDSFKGKLSFVEHFPFKMVLYNIKQNIKIIQYIRNILQKGSHNCTCIFFSVVCISCILQILKREHIVCLNNNTNNMKPKTF